MGLKWRVDIDDIGGRKKMFSDGLLLLLLFLGLGVVGV